MTAPLGLLLTPGAGGSADHRTLVEVCDELRGKVAVRRHEFEYRRAGRRGPPRVDTVVAELIDELPLIAAEMDVPQQRLAIGGRSFGGRVCSMAVAQGTTAAGLILLSYPLHPPDKPDNLRTAHFGQINVPCLFISGTRDPFATPDELALHARQIPAPVTMHFIEGARHDPNTVATRQVIVDCITEWLDRPDG